MSNVFKHSIVIKPMQTLINLIYGFEKAYPTTDSNYKHFDENSHAHLKSSTLGAS